MVNETDPRRLYWDRSVPAPPSADLPAKRKSEGVAVAAEDDDDDSSSAGKVTKVSLTARSHTTKSRIATFRVGMKVKVLAASSPNVNKKVGTIHMIPTHPNTWVTVVFPGNPKLYQFRSSQLQEYNEVGVETGVGGHNDVGSDADDVFDTLHGPTNDNSHDRVVRAAIFDLDGTLLDTEALSSQAMQMVLDRFGKREDWTLKEKILGLRGAEWSPIVVRELGLEDQLDPAVLVEEWERNLAALLPGVQAMPGAEDITKKLSLLGVPMAIATSSYSKAVAVKRACHETIFSRMQVIVCGDHPMVANGKPAPDIYIAAARELGVTPSQCVAFEDAMAGVKSATAAGMTCLALPDPRTTNIFVYEKEAFAVLPTLNLALQHLEHAGFTFT